MKKLAALVALTSFALTACVTTESTGTAASNTTQQLGMVAIKVAINAKCTTELNSLPAWKTATRVMTDEQKTNVQGQICGCVSEKAPQSVTAVDLATAAIDPQARATIVSNVVTKTINQCVAEAIK
ncbi:hypothetical protein [Acinetobacter rongchengensis]|uniref:Uncharacterized protein n=1 Tax=Acinetobacter rongchengensis TaxID=2419601 RepID=A0A3A8EH11_9GAMM|nr:hypothetical protein [Acinetobacter rongchengensis]RKG30050.1 hypothetical protein D7V20_19160 [Acinetobacter rongchengensis]